MVKIQYYVFCLALWSLSAVSFSESTAHTVDWGIGAGGQYLNDYPGSKESQVNAVPFPIIIYHGDILNIDEENGIRAELLRGSRYEVNISGDSALRSSSDKNALREGMDTLDAAFQLGPSFNILLAGNDFEDGLTIHLPLRAVITLNMNQWTMDYIGYTFSPEVTYKKRAFIPHCNFKISLGSIYGSHKYHDYYYSIDDEYVTDSRSRYQADSGFGGVFSEMGLYSQYNNWLFKLGIRYDKLSNAEFIDSDLVETENYFSASFGIGWLFHRSIYQKHKQ